MVSNDQNQSETKVHNLLFNPPIQTNSITETESFIPDVSTEQSLAAPEENWEEEHTSSRVEEETLIFWEVV